MKKLFSFRAPVILNKDPLIRSAEKEPFRIYGLLPTKENGLFTRMPQSAAFRVSERVSLLHTHTAGGRLCFTTDSSFLALGALYPPMFFPSDRTAALSGANASCFDLYVDGRHSRVLWHEGVETRGSGVAFDLADGQYEGFIDFGERKRREITLCFPSFVNVAELFVGLERDASLAEPAPYVNQLPVVFYGSSITQGACASRAGNTYESILSRRFHFDYLNLGFAGACHAEDAMIDYLCTLPMHLLVYDYDHNAASAEDLRQTHLPALQKLRRAHPDIPFVLLSKPNIHNGKKEALARMRVIEESYERLKKESGAPVHFVNGQEIFEKHDPDMMTVDGTHPTDLGFYSMADALSEVFKLYF